MAKLAYLGPEWTFSHDLARGEFSTEDHIACETLASVVERVANGECDLGLIPFYNTTRLSIEESQIELVRHKGSVFVSNVLPMAIKHHVGGRGADLSQVREFRSKRVVFHQISEWIRKNQLTEVIQNDSYQSTSAAIKSLSGSPPIAHVAAIGTASAFKNYKVPILEKNIHNKPNVTLFFTIQNKMPKMDTVNRVLMCIPRPSSKDKESVETIVSKCGCNISSNWCVTLSETPLREAYFFEINGTYSSLGLTSAMTMLGQQIKKAFTLGGYNDKCLTRLLQQPN